MSATAVACRNTDRLLAAEVPVARDIADWPFSLSLELMELVRLPGIFFLEMICLAELVVALLPVLFTRPLELYLFFIMLGALCPEYCDWASVSVSPRPPSLDPFSLAPIIFETRLPDLDTF